LGLENLGSSNKEIRELSTKILSLVPTLIAGFKDTNLRVILNEDFSIDDAKLSFLRQPPVNLRMVDFKILADALLKTPDQSYASLVAVFESYSSDGHFSRLKNCLSKVFLW